MSRIHILGLTALAAACSAGCARRAANRPAAAPPTAVAINMRRQILNAADAGEGDAMVNQLRRRIAADPDDLAARLEVAAHYGQQGLPELQLEHLRLAASRFPASAPAHLDLARALRAAGEPQQAAESLAGFLENAPAAADAPALNLLGVCYDEAGLWQAGERAFRRALAAAPRLDYLHNNLGHNLIEQQRVAEAVAAFRQALQLDPGSETARNNLGLALARSPGVAAGEALEHFQVVTDSATARSNLAAALIEQSRYQESRRLLEAAIDYNRAHGPALSNLRLVSELDGQPATVRPRAGRNIFRWPLAFLRWAFVGGEAPAEAPPGSGSAARAARNQE